MLKNYFITAINNLIKNKLYSAINITGLAIGLAACIIIALYVKDQYSYDKQWENSDRIYRVNFSGRTHLEGEFSKSAYAPLMAMPRLERYLKNEIEQSTRTFSVNTKIDTGTSKFNDNIVLVDPSFIDMFQLEVLAGSLENTLTTPDNIALSAEAAKRYFGAQDPIGKILTLDMDIADKIHDCKITAVYRIPGNTVLDIPLLSLLDDTGLPPAYKTWFIFFSGAYFQLKKGADIDKLISLTPAFIDQYIDISKLVPDPDLSASDVIAIDFQNIETAHLESPWDTSRAGGNKTVVLSFAAIALLILLIGCFNFTILTTAKATQRAREVAMRKVMGAKRKQLIVQFLGESTFIVLLAMILSLGLVEFMLPVFESIVGKTLLLDYTLPSALFPLLALLFITGVSGGLYPAFILSGYRPADTLKANQSKETQGSISLRNVLVILQFSVSIILIIATGVIYVQIQYSINRDPGYNKDNLLVINQISLGQIVQGKIAPLKQELLNLASVSDVGLSSIQPSEQSTGSHVFTHLGRPETSYAIARTVVGYDYFQTYQIPVIAGRNYNIERDIPEPMLDVRSDYMSGHEYDEITERNIIINESAARQLGFTNAEEAVGKIINSTMLSNTNYTIIGVVADNHIFSINALPISGVYILQPALAEAITVRFQGPPQRILKQVKSVWKKVMGDVEISTVFVDQLLAQEFEHEQTEGKIFISFSLLAIIIACMGLFGSASFTVECRTKEIGLRKVMGAKVKNIVSLLLWQFSKPVLIANIIAWPVAIFIMQNWLERFPYRFNPLLMIPICLVSSLIALAIAWFTVASNTSRVAKTNPIHSLRYE